MQVNFSPKAEGSADIYLGDTRVMVGVKYEIGQPYSDSADSGVCTVMSEFVPIASPMFETGPPREDSIQLARVVDRGIRHSGCVNYKKLCIKEGKAVYILFVDCYMMNYSGNLIDAAAIGAIAALMSTRLPGAKYENDAAVWDGTYGPAPIEAIPLSISFGKIDGMIFVDPILAEEMVLDGSISFAVNEKGQIASIQKIGNALWSVKEVLDISKKAVEIANKVRDKINLKQYICKKE